MKFLAVQLIGCIIFLSSFTGTENVLPAVAKMDCCKKMAGKDACPQRPAKNESGGCEKSGCAMLFSCSICGFIPVGKLVLPSNFSFVIKKPVSFYLPGNLSTYNKAYWKPPKAC